jgi:hypothetical protein
VVRSDEVLPQIFGRKWVASGTTFGRFFKNWYDGLFSNVQNLKLQLSLSQ